MNKADKRLNILYQSILWAPRLLAAHCEFRDEIRPRVSDGDQHARVPSGSIHPSDNFDDFQINRESNELSPLPQRGNHEFLEKTHLLTGLRCSHYERTARAVAL